MATTPKGKKVTVDGKASVRGRNANGKGTVYFDEQAGRWRGATFIDGKRRGVSRRTRREAEKALAELRRSGGQAEALFGNSVTIGELAEIFLAQLQSPGAHKRRARTAKTYASAVRIHIAPVFRGLPVKDLRYSTVERFFSDLLDHGGPGGAPMQPNSVGVVKTALSGIVEVARRDDIIDVNVVRAVPIPEAEPVEWRTLDSEEIDRLLAASDGERLGAANAMLFLCSWRVSEVLGLAWSDLDLDADPPTAWLRRAAKEGPMRLEEPKAKATLGRYPLDPLVVDALKRHRERQDEERERFGPGWERPDGLDLVFTNKWGGIASQSVVRDMLQRTLAAAGIDPEGIASHTGRRSGVTWLRDLDVPEEDVAAFVGHARDRAQTTTRGYDQNREAHRFRQRVSALDARIAKRLESARAEAGS